MPQTLAERVGERKAFLNKVLQFATTVVEKKGVVIERRESSDHTRVVRELNEFAGFFFRLTTGMTYCGGNTLEVQYCSGVKHEPKEVVLSVYWQTDPDECDVRAFDEGMGDTMTRGWAYKLLRVMENAEVIIADIERKKTEEVKRLAKEVQKRNEEERLHAEAKRLKLL